MERINLEVEALIDTKGVIRPISFIWEDDYVNEITRVKSMQPMVSRKAGGIGMRYVCMIGNKEAVLYLEDGRWFMERRI